MLVIDITGMGGMPAARYLNSSLGDVEVLEDGRLVVAGQRQYLAGAALPITYGVANVMRYADVDLRTAIEMASVLPGQLVGREEIGLRVGARADLILFRLPTGDRDPIQIAATLNGGEVVYGLSRLSPYLILLCLILFSPFVGILSVMRRKGSHDESEKYAR